MAAAHSQAAVSGCQPSNTDRIPAAAYGDGDAVIAESSYMPTTSTESGKSARISLRLLERLRAWRAATPSVPPIDRESPAEHADSSPHRRFRFATRIVAAALAASISAAAIPSATSVEGASTTSARVALQAGHWRAAEAPYPFNLQTGSSAAGVDEWVLNLEVAERTAAILRAQGISTEVLPTSFALGYAPDVFVSIHVNGSPDPSLRGYFADRPANSSIPETDDRLVGLLNRSYGAAVPIPYVYRPTPNSQHYYGYANVPPGTPAALIEMGFLTNEQDRAILTSSTPKIAQALADAIEQFLSGRARLEAALEPTRTVSTVPSNTPSRTVAETTTATGRPGTIQVEVGAVLRSEPTRTSPPIVVIPNLERVSVLDVVIGEAVEPDASSWALIQWGDYRGYIYAPLVVTDVAPESTSTTAPSPATAPEITGTIRVAWGGGAVMREEPTLIGAQVAFVPDQETVQVLATTIGEPAEPEDSTWHFIRWKGMEGYVYSRLVVLD